LFFNEKNPFFFICSLVDVVSQDLNGVGGAAVYLGGPVSNSCLMFFRNKF
jgi:hypothetical protein